MMKPVDVRQGSVFLLLCAFLGSIASTAFAAGQPIKLVVTGEGEGFVGTPSTVRIELKDSNNQAALAPRGLKVKYNTSRGNNRGASGQAVIEKGKSAVPVRLAPFKAAGIVRFEAESDELLKGTLLINVLPAKHSRALHSAAPALKARSAPGMSGAMGSVLHGSGSVARIRLPRANVGGVVSAQPRPAARPLQVAFMTNPSRKLLADGKDAVRIDAFVVGDPPIATGNVRIFLSTTAGRLEPDHLTLQPGSSRGHISLTSGDVGDVTIAYENSSPRVKVVSGQTLSAKFGPPITGIVLRASPPQATLVGRMKLVAELRDEKGLARRTDEPREVSFDISSDVAEFDGPNKVTIGRGKSEASVMLLPRWVGEFTVTARTPSLPHAESGQLTISWPWLLLLFTVAGGIAGSYLATWQSGENRVPRAIVGMLVGMILYGVALTGSISLLEGGNLAVANAISAFVIAALGGWGGVRTMKWLSQHLGLGQ